MNTPDTEWETKAIDAIIATYPEDLWPEPEYKPRNAEVAWVMRCMSKAIASILEPVVEELLTSRDTYWKERVANMVIEHVGDSAKTVDQVLHLFTNEDNLK